MKRRKEDRDSVECCKALTGLCDNLQCTHWDQHNGRVDGRSAKSRRCTMWTWCDHVQAKVRCMMDNSGCIY